MDGQLVSDEPSQDGREGKPIPPKAYTETFHAHFPYYLSIGMTYDQYWNGDPQLVKAYRRAAEISVERRNQEMWLQGMYIYDALCCASPILRAFTKKGTKPVPYPKEPYPLTQESSERSEDNKDKRIMEKGKAMLSAFMAMHNKQVQSTITDAEEGVSMDGNEDRLPTDRDIEQQ